MRKLARLTAAGLSCAAALACSARAAEREAVATITALGSPVLRIDARSSSPAGDGWDASVVELRLEALMPLEGSAIASSASDRMRSDFGLDQGRARMFEDGLAKMLGSVPKGGSLSAECAPGASLTVAFDGRSLVLGDELTRRAFCGMWLSESGQADLRSGLGFK